MAAVHAHPRWIVEAFAAALGGDLTRTERVLAADNEAPRPHLVARPGRIDRDALLAQAEDAGLPAVPGRWSPHAVRLDAGDPALLPAVRDGRAGVQDEGSQLVAIALARAPVSGPDGLTVDLCAGPGRDAALLDGLLPRTPSSRSSRSPAGPAWSAPRSRTR